MTIAEQRDDVQPRLSVTHAISLLTCPNCQDVFSGPDPRSAYELLVDHQMTAHTAAVRDSVSQTIAATLFREGGAKW